MYNLFKQCSLMICALFSLGAIANEALQAERQLNDDRKVDIKQYKWFGEAPKAKLVRVVNPYGSVTSRSSLVNGVELSAAIQKIGSNPPEHTIDISDNNGVTEIVISYPKGTIRNAKGQLTGRFDLGVWLPSWIRLEVKTDFGDIKVKKSASDIMAKTNTGKITIGTSGHVEAVSERGNISVDFYGERFRQPMKVLSRFGDVKVNMSQNARVILQARAAKDIKNNFGEYKAIAVLGDKKTLSATITKPTKHKIKPVELQLAANKGRLSISIADKITHKVIKTSPSFTANGKPNKGNLNNSKQNNTKIGGQSSVKSQNDLATAG